MRPIDADEVLKGIEELKQSPFANNSDAGIKKFIIETLDIVACLCIKKAPTLDAVPVVRCTDCRYHYNLRGDQNKTTCYCDVIDMYVKRDHYCADGEPMKETKNETERYI